MVELAFEKYLPSDHSALFNGACYACRIAKGCSKDDDHRGASFYENKALSYLKQAMDLYPDYKTAAHSDEDFQYFRDKGHSHFLSITGPVH
jgi:hypothetical protein